MLHPGALGIKRFKKKVYLLAWKVLGMPRRFEFHASNEIEKHFIQDIFGKSCVIHVASNFPRMFEKRIPIEKVVGKITLASIALISPMKNYLLVLQALKECPHQVIYHIYGPVKDRDYWESCLELISNMPSNVSIQYHRDIPPGEVAASLYNCHVVILPSRSENYGHSILEGLSSGRPVITSKNTPWNELTAANAGINVEETETDILSAVNFFAAMDDSEYTKWSDGAGRYARNKVNIDTIRKEYKSMFEFAAP